MRQADQTLAASLKRLRDERGISQEELAFSTGLSVSAISRIERGVNDPRWTSVRAIAKALDIGIVDIARAVEEVRPRSLLSGDQGQSDREQLT